MRNDVYLTVDSQLFLYKGSCIFQRIYNLIVKSNTFTHFTQLHILWLLPYEIFFKIFIVFAFEKRLPALKYIYHKDFYAISDLGPDSRILRITPLVHNL